MQPSTRSIAEEKQVLFQFPGILLPWRWVPAVIGLFPLFLFVFSFFIVETPRYYILKKQPDKARLVLQRLRGPNVSKIKFKDKPNARQQMLLILINRKTLCDPGRKKIELDFNED